MMIETQRDSRRDAVEQHLRALLEDVTSEWDVGPITPDTPLASLGLESIGLVYLIAEVQQTYRLDDRLITRLRASDTTIADLRVADLVDLVCEVSTVPQP